jgi:hypothetical protein
VSAVGVLSFGVNMFLRIPELGKIATTPSIATIIPTAA